MKTKGRLFTGVAAVSETVIITGIYYYFWRIGYTHGIPGYPEYLGMGKFILMAVYALLTGIVFSFGGCFRYGRLKAPGLVIRQWASVLAVNIITYLQLSLTAKHLVAKRPIFDASAWQAVLIVIFVLIADLIMRRMRSYGKMIVVGDGIAEGTFIDGYAVSDVVKASGDMTGISSLFDKIDSYDAAAVTGRGEAFPLIIRHCLEKGIPAYVSSGEPLIYGVRRKSGDGSGYVLVMGISDGEGRLLDRVRAYLA